MMDPEVTFTAPLSLSWDHIEVSVRTSGSIVLYTGEGCV